MGITINPSGSQIVFADNGNNVVRAINLSTHVITTIAGNGSNVDSGFVGKATEAGIFHPRGVAYDSIGNLYISSEGGYIRKVDTTGAISTFAGSPGTGQTASGLSGSPVPVTLNFPYGMVVDNQNGILYVADTGANVIRAFTLTNPPVEIIVMGSLTASGNNGDGNPGTGTTLTSPTLLGLDNNLNLLVVDSGNDAIRLLPISAPPTGAQTYISVNGDLSNLSHSSANGTWTRTYRSGDQVFFNSSGQETSFQGLTGAEFSYQYDTYGRLFNISNSASQVTTINYNSPTNVTIVDPANRTTTLTLDGNGNLTNVTYPNTTPSGTILPGSTAATKSYSYYPNGIMKTEQNETGNTYTYYYTLYGRLQTVQRPDSTTLTVNDSGSQTLVNGAAQMLPDGTTDGTPGTLQSYGIGANEVADKITDENGVTTSYVKNYKGYITLIQDGVGRITQITRDGLGQVTQITRPNKSTVTLTRNASEDVVQKLDSAYAGTTAPSGAVTNWTYNSQGFVTSITSPNVNGTNPTPAGSPASTGSTLIQYEPNPSSTAYPYLPLVSYKTDAMGFPTQYSYYTTSDAKYGLIMAVTGPTGGSSSFAYDQYGNFSSVTDGDSHTTTYRQRDPAGNPMAVIDARQIGYPVATQKAMAFSYDPFNRVVTAVNQNGDTTSWTYNGLGKNTSLTDPHLNTTNYHYNTLDELDWKADVFGKTSYTYWFNGTVATVTDPNLNVISYLYDGVNRVTQETLAQTISGHTSTQDTITFNYNDPLDQTLTIINNNATLMYNLDPSGQAGSVTTSSGAAAAYLAQTLSYTYDFNGNRYSLTDNIKANSEITQYAFDLDNRLHVLADPQTGQYVFGYDSNSNLTAITRPGSTTAVTPDNVGMISAISHASINSSVHLPEYSYSRDGLGNVQYETATLNGSSFTRTFGYSAANELQFSTNNAEAPAAWQSEYFNYDSQGNRSTVGPTGSQVTYGYDTAHNVLLENDGTFTYLYDNNGNVTKKTSIADSTQYTSFTYSADNRMLTANVYKQGVHTYAINYGYDGLRRRISKYVVMTAFNGPGDPGTTAPYSRYYLYDGSEIIGEYDESGNLLARYTNSTLATDDVLAAQVTSQGAIESLSATAGTYYYIKDAVGSIVDVTDSGGNDLQHYTYSTFGEIVSTTASVIGTSRTFTGREYEAETGLYYYRARFYDPSTGRFLQRDPISSGATNLYSYASNNPIIFGDPTGLFTFSVGWTIGASAGIFVGGGTYLNIGYSWQSGFSASVTGSYEYGLSGQPGDAVSWSAFVTNAPNVSYLNGKSQNVTIGGIGGKEGGALLLGQRDKTVTRALVLRGTKLLNHIVIFTCRLRPQLLTHRQFTNMLMDKEVGLVQETTVLAALVAVVAVRPLLVVLANLRIRL